MTTKKSTGYVVEPGRTARSRKTPSAGHRRRAPPLIKPVASSGDPIQDVIDEYAQNPWPTLVEDKDTKTTGIRLTAAERAALKKIAADEGMPLSTWARTKLLAIESDEPLSPRAARALERIAYDTATFRDSYAVILNAFIDRETQFTKMIAILEEQGKANTKILSEVLNRINIISAEFEKINIG